MLWLLLLPAAAPPPVVYVDVLVPQLKTVRDEVEFPVSLLSLGSTPLESPLDGLIVQVREDLDTHPRVLFRRGELLFKMDDSIARLELQRAEATRKRAQIAIEVAEKELALAREEKAPRREISRAEGTLRLARADLPIAEASLQLARQYLDRHRVLMPMDGYLIPAIGVRPYVRPGSQLATIHPLVWPTFSFCVSDDFYKQVIAPLRAGTSPLGSPGVKFTVRQKDGLVSQTAVLTGFQRIADRNEWILHARFIRPTRFHSEDEAIASFPTHPGRQAFWLEHRPPFGNKFISGYPDNIYVKVLTKERRWANRTITFQTGPTGETLFGVYDEGLEAGDRIILHQSAVSPELLNQEPDPKSKRFRRILPLQVVPPSVEEPR